jgi:hypothetical protein
MQHLEWVFGGIGVFLLSVIYDFFRKGRSSRAQTISHSIEVKYLPTEKEDPETSSNGAIRPETLDLFKEIEFADGTKYEVRIFFSVKVFDAYLVLKSSDRFMDSEVIWLNSEVRRLALHLNRSEFLDQSEAHLAQIRTKFADRLAKHGLKLGDFYVVSVE